MAHIHLYVACSLDMLIARPDGAVDWLFTEGDYGYEEFLAGMSTTLMGYKTFEKVLSFGGEFPYKGLDNIVFTRQQDRAPHPDVRFVHEDMIGFISRLRAESKKDIWLIGGGEIVQQCHEAGLIDEYQLFVHPVILGEGLPLFPGLKKQQDIQLIAHKAHDNGLVHLHYKAK